MRQLRAALPFSQRPEPGGAAAAARQAAAVQRLQSAAVLQRGMPEEPLDGAQEGVPGAGGGDSPEAAPRPAPASGGFGARGGDAAGGGGGSAGNSSIGTRIPAGGP